MATPSLLPVAVPAAVAIGTQVQPTADPATGAPNVHVVGGGAGAPGASTSVVQAQSTAIFTWQITGSGSAVSLAPAAWVEDTVYALDAVVTFANGNFGQATTAGTSAATGTGPSTLGAGVVDGGGTLRWLIVASFPNGLVIINASTTGGYLGPNGVTSTTGGYLAASGGGREPPMGNPALLSVVVTGIVTVEGYP